jgi:purine-cytosine permease-like protein
MSLKSGRRLTITHIILYRNFILYRLIITIIKHLTTCFGWRLICIVYRVLDPWVILLIAIYVALVVSHLLNNEVVIKVMHYISLLYLYSVWSILE